MMTCLLIDSVTNAVTVSLPSLVAGSETNYKIEYMRKAG